MTLINNSIVNIAGPINTYRVPWFVPEYILVSGTSFLCAVVTAKLAALKEKNGRADITEICSDKIEIENSIKTDCFAITKAVVFPFNKEVQVMARFEDMLLFEVADYNKNMKVSILCIIFIKLFGDCYPVDFIGTDRRFPSGFKTAIVFTSDDTSALQPLHMIIKEYSFLSI